jgi:plastocyanin
MMSRRIARTLPLAVFGVALVMPGAAMASTRTVFMGLPPASQKAFEKLSSDANAFFPSTIRIRTGDVVAFTPVGFHTVDMPASGAPLPLVSPTGTKVEAIDAAGIPFWFNGLDELGFNAPLLTMNFGKTLVKGPARIASGLPLVQRPKPMRVRFNKAGRYTYYCNIHSGMKGTVRVVGKHSPVPSAKSDAALVKAQAAKALAVAKALPAITKPAANTVSVGAEGKGGVSYFGMLPDKLTVAAGTTVTFAMANGSSDVHTATFGPGDPDQKTSYLGAIAASFQGPPVFDARGAYPSEPAGSPPVAITPTLHGNGFWNAGLMDAVAASPLPGSGSVTFSTPGTYPFVCLIHTNMKGTITVQ